MGRTEDVRTLPIRASDWFAVPWSEGGYFRNLPSSWSCLRMAELLAKPEGLLKSSILPALITVISVPTPTTGDWVLPGHPDRCETVFPV